MECIRKRLSDAMQLCKSSRIPVTVIFGALLQRMWNSAVLDHQSVWLAECMPAELLDDPPTAFAIQTFNIFPNSISSASRISQWHRITFLLTVWKCNSMSAGIYGQLDLGMSTPQLLSVSGISKKEFRLCRRQLMDTFAKGQFLTGEYNFRWKKFYQSGQRNTHVFLLLGNLILPLRHSP